MSSTERAEAPPPMVLMQLLFGKQLTAGLQSAGYPASADPARINHVMVLVILFVLVLYVTMVYGPIAAWLVELFPAGIR